MKKDRFSLSTKLFENSFYAVLTVAATTVLLLLIGLDKLGEAVIALLYMVPVVWSAARWGQGPGVAAALAAALFFDFYFIPPFYTFAVGRLAGAGYFPGCGYRSSGAYSNHLITRTKQRARGDLYV